MAEGEQVGAAFVRIGGDSTDLKRAYDQSLRLTQRSLATLSQLTEQFGAGFAKELGDVGKMLTGPTGALTGALSLVKSLGDMESIVSRLVYKFGQMGLSDKQVKNLLSLMEAQAKGTPFSARQVMAGVESGVLGMRGPNIEQNMGKIIEMAMGATVRVKGLGFQQAMDMVMQGWLGKGVPGGLKLPAMPGADVNFQRRIMEKELLENARFGRSTLWRDPLTGGMQSMMSDLADTWHHAFRKVGRTLFGGFSREQILTAGHADFARRKAIGPTASGMGYTEPGQIPGPLAAWNRFEVAGLSQYKQGDPAQGLLSKGIASFGNLITEVDALVVSLGDLRTFADNFIEIAARRLTDVDQWWGMNPGYGMDVTDQQSIDISYPLAGKADSGGYVENVAAAILQGFRELGDHTWGRWNSPALGGRPR